MIEHAHIWNKYNEAQMLCCAVCDMTYNKHLTQDLELKD